VVVVFSLQEEATYSVEKKCLLHILYDNDCMFLAFTYEGNLFSVNGYIIIFNITSLQNSYPNISKKIRTMHIVVNMDFPSMLPTSLTTNEDMLALLLK